MDLLTCQPDLTSADTPVTSPAEPVLLDAGSYGMLRVLARPSIETGDLRCRVSATKAAGTFIVRPHFGYDRFNAATTRLIVHYGGEPPPGSYRGFDRPNRPVLNRTVTLVDYSIVDAAKALAGARTPHALGATIWRHDGGRHSVEAPSRTARHAAAILAALAIHWLQRPDRDQLRLAAARHVLRRGHHLRYTREAIARAESLIDQQQRTLAGERAHLNSMLQLLADGAATRPVLPRLPLTLTTGDP
ncbi:hypothetical protein ACWDA3_59205 [Nonomuraea rubra]